MTRDDSPKERCPKVRARQLFLIDVGVSENPRSRRLDDRLARVRKILPSFERFVPDIGTPLPTVQEWITRCAMVSLSATAARHILASLGFVIRSTTHGYVVFPRGSDGHMLAHDLLRKHGVSPQDSLGKSLDDDDVDALDRRIQDELAEREASGEGDET